VSGNSRASRHPAKVDRRARRSRDALKSALVVLVLEKGYDRVTMREIIERADVARSTFYEHFRTKEDLFAASFADMVAQLADHDRVDPDGAPTVLPALAFLRHVATQTGLLRAFGRGRGLHFLYERARAVFAAVALERLRTAGAGPDAAVRLEIVAGWIAGSFLALFRWWIERRMPCTPERLDEIFRTLVRPGVKAATEPSA